jgi:hypothetical protein
MNPPNDRNELRHYTLRGMAWRLCVTGLTGGTIGGAMHIATGSFGWSLVTISIGVLAAALLTRIEAESWRPERYR